MMRFVVSVRFVAGLLLSGLWAMGLLTPLAVVGAPVALAAEPSADETSAFNAAKELGTVEAWDAFLSHYPQGFHADLARAYLKQLPAAGAGAQAAPVGIEQPAYEHSCKGREVLKTRATTQPAKLRFVNASGSVLVLQQIDAQGVVLEIVTLQPETEIVLDTFVTVPWIVAFQEGDCRQVFLPAPGASVARLLPATPDMGDPTPPEPANIKARAPSPDISLKCGKNYKKVGGKCVLIQNCGANAYRSAEGDCYCTKNYQMQNGRCVWKTNKNGFEIAPWKKSGCKTWQQQCNKGNAKACATYEATCQVN